METHLDTGRTGEEKAAQWLQQRGYDILHRNWRYSYYEIDIIARYKGRLHFVEVKLRSSKNFGMPEVHVNKKKFKFLAQAADQFLFLNQQYKHIQFDILSINILNGQNEIFFIQDVYL